MWNFTDGTYLNIERSYSGWKQALGAKCGKKYQEYYVKMKAMNETFLNAEGTKKVFEHPSVYFFTCENRVAG